MVKKFWTVFLAGLLILPMLFQAPADAAVKFRILIDGDELETGQAPIMIQGRVMLPMRAIFEALDAKVTWNQKTQTVKAVKNSTTIVLKINSKTAQINGKTVGLDVPAKNLKGTTMVPVRFVSESLGQKVGWNSRTKTVTITTKVTIPDTGRLGQVSYVSLQDVGNAGDGRDLQVMFTKSNHEQRASHYRIMIVKSSKSYGFDLSSALRVPSSNYTVVFPKGTNPTTTLLSSARDVDGDYIRNDQTYVGYVMAVGNYSNETTLSSPSPALTLKNTAGVEAVTNVKSYDISDFGDGRDLSVSFTRAGSESQISNYRIFVVKTYDAGRFDLNTAKNVSSYNYTTVSKTSSSSSTLSAVLGSSARDTSGEYIRNGIAYTVYVMSVSSNESSSSSRLSAGSPSVTLGLGSSGVPVINQVTDVNDYGDGRDLRVTFTKVADESAISHYRIFVVKSSDASYFNLSRANNVSSYNYTQVNKTGGNITYTLSSGARDIDGSYIKSGVYYRVFVMAVGYNSANNALSSSSSDIMLLNNNSVAAVTGLSVKDISDFNDGRDIHVSFNRAVDESNINHYRAFVVKSNKVGSFDLAAANRLSSYYYTQINKTGYNIAQALNSNSRDTDGELITNSRSYRVFVMSVGSGIYAGRDALTSYSNEITLAGTAPVPAATKVEASDNGNNGNGGDLFVSFEKASNESKIARYQVYVVKESEAGAFTVAKATASPHYTPFDKTNANIRNSLNAGAKDVNGEHIRNMVPYRVFVLSVSSDGPAGNALSQPSNAVTLEGVKVSAPQNVAATVYENSIEVTFAPPTDAVNVGSYRVMIIPAGESFGYAEANAVKDGNYIHIPKDGERKIKITTANKDVTGKQVALNTAYKIAVLAVGDNVNTNSTALSGQTKEVIIPAEKK